MVHSITGQDVDEHGEESCAQGNCVLDCMHILCRVRFGETRSGSEATAAHVHSVWLIHKIVANFLHFKLHDKHMKGISSPPQTVALDYDIIHGHTYRER